MTSHDLKVTLDLIVKIAWDASDKVMEEYIKGASHVLKDDGSPLTKADIASHEIIVSRLKYLYPDIFMVSEEQAELHNIKSHKIDKFWLIDPLDGTKEFINRNGEFTVNIALIELGKPVLGVVCVPAQNIMYAGCNGEGAYKLDRKGMCTPISVAPVTQAGITVVASRSHGNQDAIEEFVSEENVSRFIAAGSSLKFCKVAEGSAHLYPRLGRTMEWDTAAGQAVLEAAGGSVDLLNGMPLSYGKPGFENPHFVARSK